jgi:uncharacterized protein (DUF1697 family)
MKIIELNKPITLEFVVRQIPKIGDLISIQLTNEFTDLLIELPVFWTYEKQRLCVSFENANADFKIGNKYQIVLKNGANIIYMGNLLIVRQNTNLQNYTPSNQTPQRFKSKEV